MERRRFEIMENAPLTGDVYRMRLAGDTEDVTAPGQFVDIRIEGCYLRRPISVCDAEKDRLTLIYKVVGRGTEKLAAMGPETALDMLAGLGNGFDLTRSGPRPLLVGGGIGAAPLYLLAKRLLAQGKDVRAVLGFGRKDEVFYEKQFCALGCAVTVTTVDGSYGTKGLVTDALPTDHSFYYACGPERMLRAVWERAAGPGELSFEARMGCGFGACMGCTVQTASGPKRICADGPVLRKEEVLWQTRG